MTTFLTSDNHFSHVRITQFLNSDGTKLRPFDNIEEMDELMVKNWNAVVSPKDKVYNLGDLVINRRALPILSRLNGEKILIRGNHDIFRLDEYTPYFKDVRGTHKLGNAILSHIPIHPDSIPGYAIGNIHGHLHSGRVRFRNSEIDTRYYCVSVEHTNYTPISLDVVLNNMKEEQTQ